MANILPEKKRAQLKQTHILAIVSVALFLLGVAFFIATLLLFPAFLVARGYNDVVQSEYTATSAQAESTEYTKTKKVLTDANKMIAVLEKFKKTSPRFAINTIMQLQNNAFHQRVHIRSFDFGADNTTFHVTGTVESRDALTDFVKQLKDVESFETVKVPLSDFAQKSEMTFSILIVQKAL